MNKYSFERLQNEKRIWRNTHPPGFFAAPLDTGLGKDMYNWIAKVPGRPGTLWGDAVYTVYINFPEDYPFSPPKCKFAEPLFHPNVYSSGLICMRILDESKWKESTTLADILLEIQELLSNPNLKSPAQLEAFSLFKDQVAYTKKVEEQVNAIRLKSQSSQKPK